MRHGIEGSHIVVNNHSTGIHARTYSIIKNKGNALIDKSLEMVILQSVLGLRHNDATHLVLIERLADAHLALIALLTGSHQNAVALRRCFLLNTTEHRRKIVVYETGQDDANELLWLHFRVSQTLGNDVGSEVVFTSILLDGCPALCRYAGRILQRTRYRSHRDS